MPARLESVCKFICERGGWKVSNLQLQKILYLTQMLHMGRHQGNRLVDTSFEAWDFGPVSPEAYRKVRMFGSGNIKDVFYGARSFKEDDPRREELALVCDQMLPLKPGALVDITHWEYGAWAKNYEPGVKGIVIPDQEIEAEYHARLRSVQ